MAHACNGVACYRCVDPGNLSDAFDLDEHSDNAQVDATASSQLDTTDSLNASHNVIIPTNEIVRPDSGIQHPRITRICFDHEFV